jgi:hypothetical protein
MSPTRGDAVRNNPLENQLCPSLKSLDFFGKAMRVAIYARVSTDDRGQDPENQLPELRAWVTNSGHKISREYVFLLWRCISFLHRGASGDGQ